MHPFEVAVANSCSSRDRTSSLVLLDPEPNSETREESTVAQEVLSLLDTSKSMFKVDWLMNPSS